MYKRQEQESLETPPAAHAGLTELRKLEEGQRVQDAEQIQRMALEAEVIEAREEPDCTSPHDMWSGFSATVLDFAQGLKPQPEASDPVAETGESEDLPDKKAAMAAQPPPFDELRVDMPSETRTDRADKLLLLACPRWEM